MQPGANSVKTYSHFQANPCILALAVHVRISNINGYRPLDESHHIDVVVEIVLPDVTAIHWHTLRQPIILNVWRPLVDIFCNKPKSYILEGRFIITKHAREGRKAKKSMSDDERLHWQAIEDDALVGGNVPQAHASRLCLTPPVIR